MSKILIAEDNAESRYMLEQLLASREHLVITAENGADALRLARQDPPEVIISDIMMPVMNGFRFCREVKRDPNLRNIPFIIYTATFVEEADEKLAMSLGACRFIVKSTEGEQFIKILDEALDEHRQGILPVSEGLPEGEDTLLEMYDNSLARKLAETVEQLQNERRSLKKSEERLKEAQELAQLGHWELDLKSNFLEWSDEIYRILGLKPRQFEASQEALMAVVHPEDRAFVAQTYQGSLVKKTQCEIEYRLLFRDRTVKYVNERFQTIYDDDGVPTCTMGTIQDITERKQAEENLRVSEMRFRELFDNMNNGVAVYEAVDGGRDFMFKDFNKGGECIDKIDRDEVIGRRVTEVFPGVSDFGLLDVFRRVWKTGEPERFPVAQYEDERISGWRDHFVYKLPLEEIVSVYSDETERKRMEETLYESEQLYRGLVEDSPDVIYTLSMDGTFSSLNPAFEKITGGSCAEYLGKSFASIIHPDDVPSATEIFHDVLQGETPPVFELRILTKRGENVVAQFTATPQIRDGKVKSVLSIARDITGYKKARKALEEAYDIINRSSSVAFTWKNQEGWPVEFVSENVKKVFGYTAEEFITGEVRYASCVHPEDYERVSKEVTEFSARSETIEFTHEPYRILMKDGSEKIVSDWTCIVRDNDGRITHYKGVVEDITERNRAEEALRQSEYELSIRNRINSILLIIQDEEMYGEVLKTILEITGSTYGVFGYIDENGAFICPSLTGDIWDRCEIPGKEIMFPREQWGGLWGRAMTGERTLYSNKPLTVPEGHIPIDRALDVPIIYQGELIGNILVGGREVDYGEKDIQVLEDIAANLATGLYSRLKIESQQREKKQLEAQFHHAQKMEAIGVLAGGVAHDFNNLLTMIIGNAQLVLNDLPRDNPLWEDIEEIRKAGQKGAALTRQLLAFGRSEISRPEILDLNEIVKDMAKLLKRLISENIELHTILAPDLWKVYVDPGQTEQVIMNLVINARDVMLGGGTLTVETDNVNLGERYFRTRGMEGFPGSYVMLAITDTGPGMDREVMAKMFEPFFTTKERGTGTGLGLSVVYGIVKQSKGYIWPYSEPGVGTTMKVYLPRAGEGAASATVVPAERISDKKGGGGEVVLVVEDEESVRKLTTKSLQREGYRVLAASNGEDALRISEQVEGEIHLLITDVIMPGMEGRELAVRMVALRPKIKVIYMSGYPGKTLAHNGVVASDTNFLQKPFTPEILCRTVREILE